MAVAFINSPHLETISASVVDDGNKIHGEHLSCWSFFIYMFVFFSFVMLEINITVLAAY